MQATDKRVTLVGEILSSIRMIKIFAWEKPMTKRISDARERELSSIRNRAKIFAYVSPPKCNLK
jgi:hypothetical protein